MDEIADALRRVDLDANEGAATAAAPKSARRRRNKAVPLPGSHAAAGTAVLLDDSGAEQPAPQKCFLVRKKEWSSMPDWIVLNDERGAGKFAPLSDDPLFEDGPPLLLPFMPPPGAATGKGAAVVCPGGNLEFLHPREGEPVARWIAEAFGVTAFVLRYRLLPTHGRDAMLDDFHRAVREARKHANGGPVVAFGFSAGGFVSVSGAAMAADDSSRPDAQVLITGAPTRIHTILQACPHPV